MPIAGLSLATGSHFLTDGIVTRGDLERLAVTSGTLQTSGIPLHKVAIIGSGAIGRAMAAHLLRRGHRAALWSRSLEGSSAEPCTVHLTTTGVIEGDVSVEALSDLSQVADYPTIVIALPATAYREVLPKLARHLTSAHDVVFSGSLSLAPLWLREMAVCAGASPVVAAWGTTLLAASRQPDGTLHIPFVRKSFEIASLPTAETPRCRELCTALFGIDFGVAPSLLAINLSNINPIAHAGQVLVNFSRVDKGENWKLFENFTASGVRIAEMLDSERLRIASAFGATPRSLRRHYALSYPVKDADITTMVREISQAGSRTRGPATLHHRYLMEDIPYGLVVLERLARCAGVDVPILTSVISLLEVMCDQDLRGANTILDAVLSPDDGIESIRSRCSYS